MTFPEFLHSLSGLVAAMALLSLVESLLPFARKPEWRRRHRLPNLGLTLLTLGLNLTLGTGLVIVSAWLGSQGIGWLAGSSLPLLAQIAIGVVALDAATYACHRSMHALPALWRAHRVHHSDPLVDVTTALRQHPLETLWRTLFIAVPAWTLGLPAQAIAVHRLASALQALAEHANVKLWAPLDRALSLFTCTPNMHKLHHSRRALETDSNYGNLFSGFDRAFGTYRAPAPGPCVDAGLEGWDDAASQRLGSLLRSPFRAGSPIGSRSQARFRTAGMLARRASR